MPAEILAAAPADPWTHAPRDFTAPDVAVDTPSRRGRRGAARRGRHGARRRLRRGCRCVRARPGAARDRGGPQRDMLDVVRGRRRVPAAIPFRTVRGRGRTSRREAGRADVVVCHHVLHNVVDLPPFLLALTAAAGRGVVVEMLAEHPMAWLDPLWARFHGLHRPPPGHGRRRRRRAGGAGRTARGSPLGAPGPAAAGPRVGGPPAVPARRPDAGGRRGRGGPPATAAPRGHPDLEILTSGAEQAPQRLACRRRRHHVDELHDTHPLVAGHPPGDVVDDLLGGHGRAGHAYDERLGDLARLARRASARRRPRRRRGARGAGPRARPAPPGSP